MIIKYPLHSTEGKKLQKIFTVKNKNIDRLEKMKGRKMPRLRFIKLYREVGGALYFPIWAFNSKLKKTKSLSEKFEYVDIFKWKPVPDEMQDILSEQKRVLDYIDFEDRRTWLIEMKTARGKGNTLIKMVEHFQEPTLILVHNIKTLTELVEKFRKFSTYDPGVYYSGKKKIKEITITTHTSFKSKIDLFKGKFGMIIYDEADCNTSPKMIDALMMADSDGIFWLTGTPKRQELDLDDLQLVFWEHIKISGQKNNWYNIIPNIVRVAYNNTGVYSYESFHDLKNQLIEDRVRLYDQCDYIEHNHKKSQLWLLLVDRIVECQLYYQELSRRGIPVTIVNWQTKIPDDEKNILEMIEKKWIIIGTSWKMSRGVDIPKIDSIYLFYPCRFEGSVIQAVGRWLRVCEWKDKVFLHDWNDLPVLKWQGVERARVYSKEYIWCEILTHNMSQNEENKS